LSFRKNEIYHQIRGILTLEKIRFYASIVLNLLFGINESARI